MVVELAVLVPFVIAMLLLVVAFGRVTHARQLVDQAAAAAARAASLAGTPGAAGEQAQSTAIDTLTGAGLACPTATVDVDASALRPGGQVSVTVACAVDLSAVTLLGVPGTLTMTATAASPIESYRDLTAGGAP
jgi:Flp pilus assembly protein TadG